MNHFTGYREYYIRDAQGNIMATYRSQLITVPSPEPQGYAASLRVTERPVYGSSRLGTYARWEELYDHPVVSTPAPDPVQPVDLNYELTDHLGNVTAVVTGRLLNGNGGGTPKQAELVSAQGYEAFGSLLPGRNYSSSNYNFGFGGQLKDDEIYGATGTSYTAEFWQYDPRTGRRWNLDPVDQVSISNYAAFSLNPIVYNDPDGDCPTCPGFFFKMLADGLKNPNGFGAHYVGASVGIVNHAQGTWNAITHPIETAKTAMAAQRPGSPENIQATIGMVKSANALVNGNGFERGEVMGGMAAGLVEGAVLTKGAGALMRTGTAPALTVATEGSTVSTTAPLRFSQSTASAFFSEEGAFAGRSVASVADDLRAGTMSPTQVPVQTVPGAGSTLIVNTRSSLALKQAGIPQSSWNIQSMAGVTDVEMSITNRLSRNNLTGAGTDNLRVTGSGSNASTYRP